MRKVVVLVVVCSALLAAAAAAGGKAVPPCQAGQLSLKLTQPDAGVGHRALTLVATNRGTIACSLYGYPGLRLLTRSRKPMETHVSHGRMYFHPKVPLRAVLLRPAKSARAWLEYSAVPTGGEPVDRQCEPTSAYLRVTPPGSKTSAVLEFGDFACGHGAIVTSAFFV